MITTDPSFVSLGSCNGMYRCNEFLSVADGDFL